MKSDQLFSLLVHGASREACSCLFFPPRLLQIPEELQLPGSKSHFVSLRSHQWNRTSGATDICRRRIHGSTGRPVQTAGYQDQAFPATVSRMSHGLFLFIRLLFLCLGMLSPVSFLPSQDSRRKLATWPLVLAPSDPSCSQLDSRTVICAIGKQ